MVSRVRRGLVALFLGVAVFLPLLAATDAGAGTSRVGVVVNHGDGSVDTECVKIKGEKIKAITLLTRTSFDMYTQADPSFGRSICWLDGEGSHPSCFGDLQGRSWNLYVRKKGQDEPKIAPVGASSLVVRAGGVLHALFDSWDEPEPDVFVPPPPPDAVSLKTICSG
jgi:hypothetical protein